MSNNTDNTKNFDRMFSIIGDRRNDLQSIEWIAKGFSCWQVINHDRKRSEIMRDLENLLDRDPKVIVKYTGKNSDNETTFHVVKSGDFSLPSPSIDNQIADYVNRNAIPSNSVIVLYGKGRKDDAFVPFGKCKSSNLIANMQKIAKEKFVTSFQLQIEDTLHIVNPPLTLRKPDAPFAENGVKITVGNVIAYVSYDEYRDETELHSDNFDFGTWLTPDKERADGLKRPSVKINNEPLFRRKKDNTKAWLKQKHSPESIVIALSEHIRYTVGSLTVNGQSVNLPTVSDPTVASAIDTDKGVLLVKSSNGFTIIKATDALSLDIIAEFGLPIEKQSDNGFTYLKYDGKKLSFKQLDNKFAKQTEDTGSLASMF